MEDDEATVGRHTGPVRRERLAAVEGLRGIAIVLVVVSHVWVLWPTQGAQATAIGGLFRSGNLSVSVFLVLAGFFLVRSLLRDAEVGRIDIKESILRRWARVSAHVYTLVLAMLVVTALDAPSTYAPSDTARSALRIVTYTWNWFAMREPLLSRPDGGHLWFTSVYLQVTVALVLLVAALVRRRLVLIVTLIGLVVAVTVWRAWSAANEGEWVAFLRTTTRMDGMLWGALLATVLPWLPRLSRQAASALLAVSAAGILLLFLTASDSTYFGAAGVAGGADQWSSSAAFMDIDHDGDLDLFVANYVRWSREIDFQVGYSLDGKNRAYGPPMSFQGSFPYLYRNDGGGRFTDISDKAGVQVRNTSTSVPAAKSLGIAPADLDGDGWIDFIVANDTVQNLAFTNRHNGTFGEAGDLLGLAFDSMGNARGAMGIDTARHRNDDALAVAIGNFANEMTALYVTQGKSSMFADEDGETFNLIWSRARTSNGH